MKLLIITQKIERDDAVLGFFHHWLEKFSEKFEKITAICLEMGGHILPSNVKVLSLGKEGGESRVKYLWNFYKYIWRERKNYDAVFVHMNQEYVLLGGIIWKLLGKKIYFWRNHKKGGVLTKVSVFFSRKVFCTSPESFTAKFKKTILMPVGVDTNMFNAKTPIALRGKTLLSLGRVDSVKNVDILADAFIKLRGEGVNDVILTIAGSPSAGNENYFSSIRRKLKSFEDDGSVVFFQSVAHNDTVDLFNKNKVFVNLTAPGSFDKTIIEAMACGCLVIAANRAVWNVIGEEGKVESDAPNIVAEKIKATLALYQPEVARRSSLNRDFVVKNHSLAILTERLFEEIGNL